MKNNHSTIYALSLMVLDCLGLMASFLAAFLLRSTVIDRPLQNEVSGQQFFFSVLYLLPIWIAIFQAIGLYNRQVYTNPVRHTRRLILASVCGVMMMISLSFFTDSLLFPAKLIPVYATIISFLILTILRSMANGLRLLLLNREVGIDRLLIVGNSESTAKLATYIQNNPKSGFKVEAIVAENRFLPKELKNLCRSSIDSALKCCKINSIIQTDNDNNRLNYLLASQRYIDYYYLPNFNEVAGLKHSIEILGRSPLVLIHSTPLLGLGRFVKRAFDILGSSIGIVLASPIMLLVALAIKIDDPKGTILMRGRQQNRLGQFNRSFKVLKFRSHFSHFDGKTDEEVFTMIGQPELIKIYRQNGDKLDNDFRVTKVGKFIRRWSLDELPQLFNILKGDMSLVGPRPLVPHEMAQYDRKFMLLSIKPGLTGLAVVSGRRNISFEERRELDLYYAQSWSFWLDISILIRTVATAIKG